MSYGVGIGIYLFFLSEVLSREFLFPTKLGPLCMVRSRNGMEEVDNSYMYFIVG